MVEYHSGHEKVTIICPTHGLFDQDASAHLSGHGCPKCDTESRLIGIDEFIRRAEKVHGDRYCYLRSEYLRLSDPITITCDIHGDFNQRAGTHLAGSGCQRCAWGPTSKKCADWLALVAVQTGHHIQHAENGGEYRFPEMHKRKADGFDEITNTVYEYNGVA
ncbi:g917 [Coccomyxa elongata]